MNEKIVHLRKGDVRLRSLLNYLRKAGIRKSYSRNVNGATFVSLPNPATGTVVGAWAICHWKDTFTKKRGVYEAMKKLDAAYPELGIELPELPPVKVKVPYTGSFATKLESNVSE